MSRFFYTFLSVALIICQSSHATDEETAQKAVESGRYKEAITAYEALIKKAPRNKKGWLQVKLAKAYLKDQEAEKAFKLYIEALDAIPEMLPSPASDAETKLYEQALSMYLENSTMAARETANKIRQEYAPIIAVHPDYYLLNFLLAAAYANLNMYEDFFDHFYQSYSVYPQAYMAYKTKAILHIKLFEKARSEKEREAERQAILENTRKASDRYELDTSLYKLLIAFSNNDDRPKVLTALLNKIIDNHIMVPRGDIYFYANEAVEHNQIDLANKFLTKARGWYPQSKQIDAAENMIKQKCKT